MMDDLLERVGSSLQAISRQPGRSALTVLGLCIGVDVEFARMLVVHDVFDDGRKAICRGPDLGLRARREANDLRVAATFEIEDAVVRPSVFVIADERTMRIG